MRSAPNRHGASHDRRTSFGATLRESSQPSNRVGKEPSQRNWTVTGGWVIIDMGHQVVSSEGQPSISEAMCREHTHEDACGDWATHDTWRPPVETPLAPCVDKGDRNGLKDPSGGHGAGIKAGWCPGVTEEHPQKPLFLTSLPLLNWPNCRRRCCQSQWVPGNAVRIWASPN